MRGDKPLPTELKVLRMTSKKAEKLIRKITPTPAPLIDPPDWLTTEQKEEWRYAIVHAPRNVLKKIDKAVLAGFIVAPDTHRRASVAMAQTELLVTLRARPARPVEALVTRPAARPPVDTHGAHCGNEAREERHGGEQHGRRSEGRWIDGLDAIEQRSQHSRERGGPGHPARQTERHEDRAATNH